MPLELPGYTKDSINQARPGIKQRGSFSLLGSITGATKVAVHGPFVQCGTAVHGVENAPQASIFAGGGSIFPLGDTGGTAFFTHGLHKSGRVNNSHQRRDVPETEGGDNTCLRCEAFTCGTQVQGFAQPHQALMLVQHRVHAVQGAVGGQQPGPQHLGEPDDLKCGGTALGMPGQGLLGFPALVGLLGGFCAGTAYTFVRRLGLRGVKGPQIVFYFSLFSLIAVLPFCILQGRAMSGRELLFLLGAGICAAMGQIFVTKAYAYAPAKEISVYDYSQVIFSALLGFFILQEVPDLFSFIGYALIFGVALWKWKKG